jgi:hypothetical protein
VGKAVGIDVGKPVGRDVNVGRAVNLMEGRREAGRRDGSFVGILETLRRGENVGLDDKATEG